MCVCVHIHDQFDLWYAYPYRSLPTAVLFVWSITWDSSSYDTHMHIKGCNFLNGHCRTADDAYVIRYRKLPKKHLRFHLFSTFLKVVTYLSWKKWFNGRISLSTLLRFCLFWFFVFPFFAYVNFLFTTKERQGGKRVVWSWTSLCLIKPNHEFVSFFIFLPRLWSERRKRILVKYSNFIEFLAGIHHFYEN